MGAFTIVVPSHQRAEKVEPAEFLPHDSFVICVAEHEAEEYRRHNRTIEIVQHPNNVIGVSSKRQWILEHFGDCFMLDDDCSRMVSNERIAGEPTSLVGERAVNVIRRDHDLAVDMGVYLWGYGPPIVPVIAYSGLQPFRLNGSMYGYSMGIREGSGLFYHKGIQVIDDIWIVALNTHFNRICLIDKRFSFVHRKKDSAKPGEGGMAEHRTFERYLHDLDLLKECFGEFADVGQHGQTQEILLRDFVYPWK